MIRYTLSYLRPISLFLATIFLLQCCKAYYKETVSIEDAIGSDKKRVKIIKMDNSKYVYKSLNFKNDSLYGHQKGNKNIETFIQTEDIKEIHLLNIKKSRVRTALLIIFIPVGILFVFQLAPQQA